MRDVHLPAGGRDVCIWAVIVLPDGTMVSGDSTGCVVFWDAQFGTRLHSFTHGGDVLALAAAADGSTVFASGVDPRICMYQLQTGEDAAHDTSNAGTDRGRPGTPLAVPACLMAGCCCSS